MAKKSVPKKRNSNTYRSWKLRSAKKSVSSKKRNSKYVTVAERKAILLAKESELYKKVVKGAFYNLNDSTMSISQAISNSINANHISNEDVKIGLINKTRKKKKRPELY